MRPACKSCHFHQGSQFHSAYLKSAEPISTSKPGRANPNSDSPCLTSIHLFRQLLVFWRRFAAPRRNVSCCQVNGCGPRPTSPNRSLRSETAAATFVTVAVDSPPQRGSESPSSIQLENTRRGHGGPLQILRSESLFYKRRLLQSGILRSSIPVPLMMPLKRAKPVRKVV